MSQKHEVRQSEKKIIPTFGHKLMLTKSLYLYLMSLFRPSFITKLSKKTSWQVQTLNCSCCFDMDHSLKNPHTSNPGRSQSILKAYSAKIQRRAARFVKKCNQCTPGTVTSLLEELKWPSLEQRRKQTRLTNLSKIVNGTLAVVIPNYFRQKKRQTRNYHPLKFVNAGCRTNIYKYSFFPRSVKEWNETIIEAANTEAFKLALKAQASPH